MMSTEDTDQQSTNQQSTGQKVTSQASAGAIAAWFTMTWVPPESQAIAGPAILVIFNSIGKVARNILKESGWAKYLP